jgi:hypothetical protein
MERWWQLGGFHSDLRIQLHEGHTGLRKRGLDPKPPTSFATSQHEMMLTPKIRSEP